MDKVVKIVGIKNKSSDYKFWMSKTESERLEAIEMLRSQYIDYIYHVNKRLQRVCRVTNKAQS
jgi:hypothetical protein